MNKEQITIEFEHAFEKLIRTFEKKYHIHMNITMEIINIIKEAEQ